MSGFETEPGFVFYPREYVLEAGGGHALGVDAAGRPAKLTLRIRAASRQAAEREGRVLPDWARYADLSRRNNFACEAHAGNSAANPRGILLAERCRVEDAKARHYSAGWASVLRADASESMPALGHGFVEMRLPKAEEGSEHERLLAEYKAVPNADGRRFLECDRLAIRILEAAKPRFSVVHLDYPRTFALKGAEDLDRAMAHIDQATADGRRGGVLLRPWREHDGRRTAIEAGARWVEPYWQTQAKRDEEPGEVRARFVGALKRLAPQVKSEGWTVDVVPFQRCNFAAKFGAQKMLRDVTQAKLSRWERIWLPEAYQRNPLLGPGDCVQLVTPLAARLNDRARSADGGRSEVVVNALAYGPRLGGMLTLDAALKPTFDVDPAPWRAPGVVRTADMGGGPEPDALAPSR